MSQLPYYNFDYATIHERETLIENMEMTLADGCVRDCFSLLYAYHPFCSSLIGMSIAPST